MRTVISIFFSTLLIAGCGGSQSTSPPVTKMPNPPPTSQPGDWTWVGGSDLSNQNGTYGTLGTPASANNPSGRYQAASWTDSSGNFWLFGGTTAPTSASDIFFNDLWKYSGGAWTWMGGSNGPNQSGIYGTQGTASASNSPGARSGAVTWTDAAGNFWLFGGIGLDVNGDQNDLNDLWKYSAGEWTWESGSEIADQMQTGVYGTQGSPSPKNVPGARESAVSWTDTSGNFWLFGGLGNGATATWGLLNDLWKYSNGQWTWVAGSSVVNQPSTYGTLKTPAPGNVPSGRMGASSWTDTTGALWLFGGMGNGDQAGSDLQTQQLNDLWKFSAGQWAWMGGSNLPSQAGVYGSMGIAAPANTPGARSQATTWTDSSGDFWLYGGGGYDATNETGALSDLWKYSGGEWTWIDGPDVAYQPGFYGESGSYGTMGIASASNSPGGRFDAAAFTDASGDLWLFGGMGFGTTGDFTYLNDLWKYQP